MREALLYYAAVVLALPLALGWLGLAVYHFGVRRRPLAGTARVATTLALAAFPLAGLHLFFLLVTSGPSTAVVGMVYAPVYAGLWAAAVFLLSWSLGVIGELLAGRLPRSARGPARLAAAVAIVAGGSLIGWTLWQRQARLARASDPRATAEELRAVYRAESACPDPAVLAALAAHPELPADVLVALAESGAPPAGTPSRRARALRRPARPPLWFLRLAPLPESASALERLAARPDAPPAVLRRLAHDPAPAVAAAVARHPRTPPALLAELARRPEPVVAGEVAIHPAVPPETLADLGSHASDAVRGRVAASPRTPAEALRRLARDRSWVVRGAVARNPAAPPAVLAELAVDPDAHVRYDVAGNPGTPAAALARLSNDTDERVRRYATQRLPAPQAQ